MNSGALAPAGSVYSVIAPVLGTSFPILLMPVSTNHKLPSGPETISSGPAPTVGVVYSAVTVPFVSIRSIELVQ